MPVLTLECPTCRHTFHGMVLAGTRPPQLWICSRCGEQAQPIQQAEAVAHPWDGPHGIGMCPCCSPAAPAKKATQG